MHADISSRRLLVMDRFDGPSIRDADPLLDELGADRKALARELLGTLLNQILQQGTFHADPHPGNILVLRSGQLGLIDFGSVGRLDIRQQTALRRLLVAVAQRDPTELFEAVTELATSTGPGQEQLEQTLAAFMTGRLTQMIAIILLVIHRAASIVPLTLLALAFAIVVVIAGIWPSEARQNMVERLGTALKDFGGGWSPPVQRPNRRGPAAGQSDEGGSQNSS